MGEKILAAITDVLKKEQSDRMETGGHRRSPPSLTWTLCCPHACPACPSLEIKIWRAGGGTLGSSFISAHLLAA